MNGVYIQCTLTHSLFGLNFKFVNLIPIELKGCDVSDVAVAVTNLILLDGY